MANNSKTQIGGEFIDLVPSTDGDYALSTHTAGGTVLAKNYMLEAAAGNIEGVMTLHKFGAAPSGVQITSTDIWSRADSTPTQQVWLAPTAARIHTFVSSSTADVFNVIYYGLSDWDTAETGGTLALNGTVPVNSPARVIIHRAKIVPTATAKVNAGTILITAAAPDSTVTAVIMPGDGQTEMAIYGIPSTKNAFITSWDCQIDKTTGTAASCDFEIRVNENPDVQTTGFIRKSDISVQSTGVNSKQKIFNPPYKIAGPAIIKVTGTASGADLDGESSFDLIVRDK